MYILYIYIRIYIYSIYIYMELLRCTVQSWLVNGMIYNKHLGYQLPGLPGKVRGPWAHPMVSHNSLDLSENAEDRCSRFGGSKISC